MRKRSQSADAEYLHSSSNNTSTSLAPVYSLLVHSSRNSTNVFLPPVINPSNTTTTTTTVGISSCLLSSSSTRSTPLPITIDQLRLPEHVLQQMSAIGTASNAGNNLADGQTGVMNANQEFLHNREAIYEQLISFHPVQVGKTLSTKERDSKGLAASTLVYGEIKFEPYALTFLKLKQLYGALNKPGGKFIDVGSGTGKPVFAAALLHEWTSCQGIEILEGLYGASLQLLDRWKSNDIQQIIPDTNKKIEITFTNGDATVHDWSDADVFFMNSTCYDEPLMTKLAVIADKMHVGAYGITFTKRLPSAKWKVLESEVYSMSWGSATVFIQQKILP